MTRRETLYRAILALSLLAPTSPCRARDEIHLPWREAGLTERQAAAHLLDRFAYGPRPGDVDRVVAMGLETWLERQLQGDLPDPKVEGLLARFRSLSMTTREIAETYPGPGVVFFEAREKGLIDRGEAGHEETASARLADPYIRRRVIEYARGAGYRPQRELLGEAMARKLLRAVYSENQLAEVLTDFWFNHFNVSMTDSDCRLYVPTFERDAIRPFVTGAFRDMLEATARHPAMLLYLDNARSVANAAAPVRFDAGRWLGRTSRGGSARDGRHPRGLNENYARELLELHTLGVDGGYGQQDVVEVARAFTGWTTYPPGRARAGVEQRVERAKARFAGADLRRRTGFVFDEDFIFRADAHDAGPKTVLGRTLPPGRGIEDGLDVLAILAAHPSTARHLAAKIAARFVADEPPESLVDRLAEVYLGSGGNLRDVLVALAESPEFWSPQARHQKIKSPFELAVSALRATGARITDARESVEWISRMGEPLYAYQAPTGYPDRADFWVNTGSLLARMNFALQLASGRIAGVELDLAALNRRPDRGSGEEAPEPESLAAALETYVGLLLPERDPEPTVSRLRPLIHDSTAGPLAGIVGVILGSPEFQRR